MNEMDLNTEMAGFPTAWTSEEEIDKIVGDCGGKVAPNENLAIR
jgi:hypothetical protein